ncbi:hypothetical protein Tco_0360655 [Tanacetum coccineum]
MHGDCQRFNAVYKHLTRKSEENEGGHIENAKTSYIERYGNKRFQYVHSWNILKNYPKWGAREPIDEDNLAELFGPDPREPEYEAKRKEELGMLECRELEFLMIDPSLLSSKKRAIIEWKQAEIMRKYSNA